MTDDNQTNGVTEKEIRELEKNNLNRNKVSAEKIYISTSKKQKTSDSIIISPVVCDRILCRVVFFWRNRSTGF